VHVRRDGSGVDLDNVKMAINPFDEIAVEEALRLREAGMASEVVLVTVGPAQSAETIRTGLAMGADRGIHVRTDEKAEPLSVAKLLAAVALQESPGLVILGKQAVDHDNNQTGQMLAGILGWPQVTFASKLVMAEGGAEVTRETDMGRETLRVALPAVITTDLRLNDPRHVTLPNIMKAKKKPIDEKTPAELGVAIEQRLRVLKVSAPPVRQAGIRVQGVDDLVRHLSEERGII
jgi:electron transfer flavoprotein beta subunit